MTKEVVVLAHKKAPWAVNFYKKNGFTLLSGNYKGIKNCAGGAMRDFALPAAWLMKRTL